MNRLLTRAFAAALSVIAPIAAHATSYDAVAQFSQSNPSGPFSYGHGSVGAGFVPMSGYMTSNCVGAPGLACHNVPSGNYTLPIIGKNITAAPITFYTNVLPPDELFIQADSTNGQAILRFTAPNTGIFPFFASFERIDNADGSGDGTFVGLSVNGAAPVVSKYLANSRSGPASSYTLTFQQALSLTAGDTVDFYLDKNGSIDNDGTGLRVLVAEPASIGLLGMALLTIGGVVRRRRG